MDLEVPWPLEQILETDRFLCGAHRSTPYKPPLKPHARWVWDLHASELLLDGLLLQPWLPCDVDNIICPQKKHDIEISHDTYSGSAKWCKLCKTHHIWWYHLVEGQPQIIEYHCLNALIDNGLFSWCCQLSSSCLHPPTGPLLCPMAMLDPGSSAAQENVYKCTNSPSAYHEIYSIDLTDWLNEWMKWRNEWTNERTNDRLNQDKCQAGIRVANMSINTVYS